jgi:hypothetical protein
MATEPQIVHVTTGSELDWLVEAAKEAAIILEKDGIQYRVSREDNDLRARDDPEAILTAIRAARGTFSPEEGEELKTYISRGREEGSRPADRP